MNLVPKDRRILTQEELQKLTSEDFDILLASHQALFAANAALSFRIMRFKLGMKQIFDDQAAGTSLVFTNFESGQRGYEFFADDQEADERFDYLNQYYSEAFVHFPVEIGIAVVVKSEKHGWDDKKE